MDKIKRLHRGCGGLVKNGVCTKCGKKWGTLGEVFSRGIEERDITPAERERAYRRRIRGNEDIV